MSPQEVVAHLAAVRAAQAERSLHRFLRDFAWPVLQPGTPFVDNWHVGVICDHLEAVAQGKIKRLIINLPFRMLKSTIVSQTFPAWEWLRNPSVQYLTSSYAKDLATRDAVDSRRIIESPMYQAAWGHRFKLTSDQNVKTRYENDKKGTRTVTSTDSAGTGFGGNRVIIDDPVSAKEADSPNAIASSIAWWKNTASTRLNNAAEDAIILIHQRLSVNDLTGHILKEEGAGWDHLVLPMRYDPKLFKTTSLGYVDPRKTKGELLSPARLPEAAVAEIERRVGLHNVAAQLQQNPSDKGVTYFKIDSIKRVPSIPLNFEEVIQSWDTASKTGEAAANSSGVTAVYTSEWICIIDLWANKVLYPELKQAVKDQHKKHKADRVLIEDKSTGEALIPDLAAEKDSKHIVVEAIKPVASKEQRALNTNALIENGLLMMLDGQPWNAELIDEMRAFPAGLKDRVDAVTQLLNWWRTRYYDIKDSDFAPVAVGQSGAPQMYGSLRR